jgi:multiple sugar transport system ATP-binding protein
VAYGIRPEHIAVNAGSDWPFSAEVPVEVVEPMGADTLLWTRLGGQNLTLQVTSERTPAVGDRVVIGFDPINASLFDADDGERL